MCVRSALTAQCFYSSYYNDTDYYYDNDDTVNFTMITNKQSMIMMTLSTKLLVQHTTRWCRHSSNQNRVCSTNVLFFFLKNVLQTFLLVFLSFYFPFSLLTNSHECVGMSWFVVHNVIILIMSCFFCRISSRCAEHYDYHYYYFISLCFTAKRRIDTCSSLSFWSSQPNNVVILFTGWTKLLTCLLLASLSATWHVPLYVYLYYVGCLGTGQKETLHVIETEREKDRKEQVC